MDCMVDPPVSDQAARAGLRTAFVHRVHFGLLQGSRGFHTRQWFSRLVAIDLEGSGLTLKALYHPSGRHLKETDGLIEASVASRGLR